MTTTTSEGTDLIALLDGLDASKSLACYADSLLREGLTSGLITEMAKEGMVSDLMTGVQAAIEKEEGVTMKEGTKLQFRFLRPGHEGPRPRRRRHEAQAVT